MNNIEKYTVPCSGLDRVDNDKGYTVENSVACCTRCNTMKSTYCLEEFYRRMEEKYDTNEHARKIIDFKRAKASE